MTIEEKLDASEDLETTLQILLEYNKMQRSNIEEVEEEDNGEKN